MRSKTGRIIVPSLKNRITIMFVISAIIIECIFFLFWSMILAPRLKRDMVSYINALSQSNALILANALSEKPIDRGVIEHIIDDLMLLKESVTQTPFVNGVELVIDYDVLIVDQGSLDITRWQTLPAKQTKEDLMLVEVPLFDRSSRELLGIARFYSSKLFFQQLENDVINSFFTATLVIMGMLLVCWTLLIILLSPLNQLSNSLGDRDIDGIAKLPALKGWVSQEIYLVKNAMDDLFSRIHQYTQGLMELNIMLKTQQELSLDGILVVDQTGGIVSVNQRFMDMWGIPPDVAATMSSENYLPFMLDLLEDPEKSIAQLNYLRQHSEAKSHAQVRLKDGRTFERYSSPMIRDAQTYLGRIWFYHDITEHKYAQDKIQRLNEELEQRVFERTAQLERTNQELEAFSYSVSHDLRAPLRHIDGFSLALVEDYEDQLDQDAKSYLKLIRKACTLMGRLIDDMLKLSRIGRQELLRTTVDLSATATEIAEDLTKSAPDRQAAFTIAPGLVARADQRLLRILMDNLIRNAWKFSSIRERTEIEINCLNPESAEQAGHSGKSVFYVKDNGTGFDMTYADKLFVAFQRLHGKEEFEGTGIGLATVQRIINRHGGTVWAESEIDKGATFFFTIE